MTADSRYFHSCPWENRQGMSCSCFVHMCCTAAVTRQILPISRFFHSSSSSMRPLTLDSLNPALLKVEYAVRGELAIKAESLREKLKNKDNNLPFDKVISSNIGNPQQKGLDQRPITFIRQVCVIHIRVSLIT